MYVVVGTLAGIENIFPPVPADTAVAVGAFLSVAGPVSAWGIFAVTWVCNVCTACGTYVFARRVGRAFMQRPIGRRLLSADAMARIERLYARHGLWGIFFSRFVPMLRAVVPPFAGVAGLGPVKSLVPVAVASGLWYGALTFVAATAIRRASDVTHFVSGMNRAVAIAVGAAAVIGLVVYAWHRHRRRRRERR